MFCCWHQKLHFSPCILIVQSRRLEQPDTMKRYEHHRYNRCLFTSIAKHFTIFSVFFRRNQWFYRICECDSSFCHILGYGSRLCRNILQSIYGNRYFSFILITQKEERRVEAYFSPSSYLSLSCLCSAPLFADMFLFRVFTFDATVMTTQPTNYNIQKQA